MRTKGQNIILAEHVLDALAAGRHLKSIASDYNIPVNTLRKLMQRYRNRLGFRTIYQAVAARAIVNAIHKTRRK